MVANQDHGEVVKLQACLAQLRAGLAVLDDFGMSVAALKLDEACLILDEEIRMLMIAPPFGE